MDELLLAARTVVSLAAVVGLLLFLAQRVQKGQAAGDGPFSALVPQRLGRLRNLPGLSPRTRTASPSRPRSEKITVVARTGLGGRAQLVVAEFGGIRYVLGVSEKGIDVVDTQEAPIDDAERSENVVTLTDTGSPRGAETSGAHAA
ncbi:flagellar biosynthetic protein FliO [Microbacterium sp. SL75]|uniref:flagellar biosynthetic protein FliO n=1 Tax=Microbacterium sp. SL75 TaxID=2995140 RepID=UPI00226E4608|nr:flagellar biosynthetic protein FliO [Microbacterium sp. SL75]WAC67994.1 flagellar biosynthetic protein FliO [Microbacterium sp. SL75]